MSRYLDTSSTTQVFEIMSNIEDTVVPRERNLYGHPTIRKSSVGTTKGKSTELGMSVRASKRGLFLSVYVDDINIGTKQNLSPMWKKLKKPVDLGEPTSVLDHAYLGCTQRECKTNEKNIEEF